MIANYDYQPSKLEAVGDGTFFYRWNIIEKDIQTEEHTIHYWECDEVIVDENPTIENVTKAVIRSIWTETVEAKLINDFNAYNLGLLSQEFEQNYLNFLSQRQTIKDEIKSYFDEISQE